MGFTKKKSIRKMLMNDELVLGFAADIPHPAIAEIVGLVGCDYVRLDLEHGIYNLETIANIVRTADLVGISVIVRVPEKDSITKMLDFGVTGIQVPDVCNADEVKQLVNITKYYPVGQRGLSGVSRLAHYKMRKMSDVMKEANEEVILIVQIENKEAIDNLEEIVKVDGLDVVAGGPADISSCLGFPGQTSHPEVIKVENKLIELARNAGKSVQLAPSNMERAMYLFKRGVRLMSIGRDTTILKNNIKNLLDQHRKLT